MTDHLTFDELCDVADAPTGAPAASAAREHLATCADCEEELAAITALSAETALLPREIAPPAEVWTAIRAELGVRAATQPRWWESSSVRLLAAGLVIAVSSSALTMLATRARREPASVATAVAPAPAPRALPAHLASAERGYARDVEELRRALNERRDSLSASTVATVEQSLRVADSAIAEAREALERDPANGVLAEIFASNYERKIDLLRRATELAPRT
ncbi:MAG: hypothetical protein ABIP93_09005 [Gemmatimonadaceae bacterium]